MPFRVRPVGYSLLEMLAVLVIVGVLCGLAAPSLRGHLDARRTRAALRQLAADVALARMHALRLGRPVEVHLEWDAAGQCVRRYEVRGPDGAPPLRRVDLSELLGRGCLRTNNRDQPLRFNSRGLPAAVIARTVTARSGAVQDSLVISQLGRLLYR